MIKTYDLIFSIGEACSCTSVLREFNLQIESYPFDWLFGSNFVDRCKILTSEFYRFVDKDDLIFTYENKSIFCNAYYNKFNDITFNHDFIKSKPFDEAYEIVKEKFERRINRLLHKIKTSNSILAVYIETPTKNHPTIQNKELVNGYNILKEKFGKKINLLYISNSKEKNSTEIITDGLIRITCNYKDGHSNLDYIVQNKKLKNIFKNYRLKLPFWYLPYKKTLKFTVNFFPIKKIRHKLRKTFHL